MVYRSDMAEFVVSIYTVDFRLDNSSDAIRKAIRDIYFDEPDDVVDRIEVDVRNLLDNPVSSNSNSEFEYFIEQEVELRKMIESGIVGPPTQEDLDWLAEIPVNEEFGTVMTPTVKRLLTAGLLKVDLDNDGIEVYKVV